MKIPEPKNTLSGLIDKSHQDSQDPPRYHLGCSMLGHPCDRWLWLSFRWAVVEKFDGRILRLFRRGKMEEATVLADLAAAGVGISSMQDRVDFGSHVSGSTDGTIENGVPEAPKSRHVLEIKTHSKKSFDELEKNGVEKAKFQHFVQMQVYMYGMDIERALYYAVCKDDDRIYTERVRLDKEVALKYIARGQRIALTERMPEPLSADPSWYQCKFCAAHEFCFKTKTTEQVNCRTCAHSTPTKESTFTCARWDNCDIPNEAQLDGCPSHVLHPDLVPWKMGDSNNEWEAVYIINDAPVRNGEGDMNCFSSKEILKHSGVVADDFVQGVKAMGGTFIEDEDVPF